MDVQRFNLEQGRSLYSVSRNSGQNTLGEEVYFATPESAILSLFHLNSRNWNNRDLDSPVYLKGYKLLEAFNGISPSNAELQRIARLGNEDEKTYLRQLSMACSANSNGVSYVMIPVILRATIDVDQATGEQVLTGAYGEEGVVFGFVFCKSGVLLQSRNLKLDISAVVDRLRQLNAQGQLNVQMAKEAIKGWLTSQPEQFLEAIPIDVMIESVPTPQMVGNLNLSIVPSPLGYGQYSSQPSILPPSPLSPVVQVASATAGRDAFAMIPNDVVVEIALHYTLDAVYQACQTSRRFNALICDNEIYWQKRFSMENPGNAAFEEADQERRSWVNPLTNQPEIRSWKEYYRAHYHPTAEDMIGRIRRGLTTPQLLILLRAGATRERMQGTYTASDLREFISTIVGRPLGADLVSEKGILSHFGDRKNRTIIYKPIDDLGNLLVQHRPEIVTLVWDLLIQRRPEINRPGGLDGHVGVIEINVGGVTHSRSPLQRGLVQSVLIGTGFNPYHLNAKEKLQQWEYTRRALVKALQLTEPNVEPDYTRK